MFDCEHISEVEELSHRRPVHAIVITLLRHLYCKR